MRRFLGAAMATVSAAAFAPVPAGAGGIAGLFVGACTLEIQAVFASPVGRIPSASSASLTGGGTCVVNDQIAELRITGWLTANPSTGFGCAAGVAHGLARFSLVDVSGFPNPDVQLVVANHGGVITIVGFVLVSTFEGAGELIQAPAASGACAAGSITSATWTGPFAFQDPDPPPEAA